ncbi:MAG: hypothetical protein V2A76_01330 [Planctomycetota bacterium]
MKARALPLLALPLLLLVGCGGPLGYYGTTLGSIGTSLGNYGKARALDLLDVAPVSLAVGYGISAQFRATPFFGQGIGHTNNWRVGTGEQRFGPLWYEKERGFPIIGYYRFQSYQGVESRIPGGDPIYFDETSRYRASLLRIFPAMSREGQIWYPFLPPYHIKAAFEWPRWSIWNLLNVEAGVFAGVVGVRAAVSPLQIVDFVLGIITLDFANDDPRILRPLWPDPAAPSSFGQGGADPEPTVAGD